MNRGRAGDKEGILENKNDFERRVRSMDGWNGTEAFSRARSLF